MEIQAKTFATGFVFPEGPRWREGEFWFSDMLSSQVFRLAANGKTVESFHVPGQPSGLGWLPDGDLLVVSMRECRLYRRHGGSLSPYADLGAYHNAFSNDMVVDTQGRAYVGALGFDYEKGEEAQSTHVVCVGPSGEVSSGADDLLCPNGMVISEDGRRLIVGETASNRLTAFDIDADGKLSSRRVFADLGDFSPDGICLDADGYVWVATTTPTVLRVKDGGAVIDQIEIDGANAYACMLGGADGRDLFLCCAPDFNPVDGPKMRRGRIDVARAPAPHAGLP